MPSEFNHIDDFFRSKDGESRADLSARERHWAAMQQQLRTVKTVSVRRLSWTRIAAAAILLAIVSTVALFYRDSDTVQPARIANEPKPVAADPVTTIPSTSSPVVKNNKPVSGTGATRLPETRYELPSHFFALPYPKNDTAQPAKPVLTDEQAYRQFFTALQKPAQVFRLDPARDTTIICAEGSILHVPAGSFETISGVAISESLEIRVQEFYRMPDIIAANLTTMSDGAALVTGGMLHLEAQTAGMSVRVRQGRSLKLSMPTKKFDSRMQLFTGQEQQTENMEVLDRSQSASGRVNWKPAGQAQRLYPNYLKTIPVCTYSDNPYATTYRHAYNPSKAQSVAKFRIPWYCPDSDEQVDSILTARYGHYYDIIQVKRQRRPRKQKNRQADLVAKKSWYDSQMVGDTVTMHISTAMRLKYITREDSLAWEERWRAQMQPLMYDNEIFRKNGFYEFQLTTLGWINCDRFLDYARNQKTDLVFRPSKEIAPRAATTVLFFRRLNVLMDSEQSETQISFRNIPKGEEVVVISSTAKGNRFLVAVQTMEVKKSSPIVLEYRETTVEEFRKILTQLSERNEGG